MNSHTNLFTEQGRIEALQRLHVLDSEAELEFESLVRIAALVCDVPISLISLVDTNRQWFKANYGLPGITETPRDVSFCSHAITGFDLFLVPDSHDDPRFKDTPLVTGTPNIRFYAGMPLTLVDGSNVGTLCVIDDKPRSLTDKQVDILRHLSRVATRALEARADRIMANERQRLLYETTPAIMHSLDLNGRILNVSDRWLEVMGYERDEVIGRFSGDFLTGKSRLQALGEANEALLNYGFYERVEHQAVTKTGEVIDILVSAKLERDANGKPARSNGMIEDITARRSAERALASEKERLQNIIEGTQSGTWEWNINTGESRFNERWASMVGYTLEELQPVSNETWVGLVNPDDFAASMIVLNEHFAGQREAYEIELRMRHKDGHWVWILTRGKVLSWTPDGKPEWMFGTHQDVTVRKIQEEKLRKSEGFLERTGRAAGVGGWEIDLLTGDMVWSNECYRIHGLEQGKVMTPEDGILFYAPEAQDKVRIAFYRALDTGQGFDLTLPLIKATGEHIWVRSVGAVETVDGKPVRMLGSIKDITQEIIQSAALKEANERSSLATDSAGVGIWDLDMVRNTVHWDAKTYELFGLSPDDPRTVQEIWKTYVHPEDFERIEVATENAKLSGRKLDDEFRVIRPDGTYRHLRTVARIVDDADGNLVRIIGTNWDVTKEREMAALLVEQHDLMRVTLDSIADAVITVASDGNVQWLNPVAERLLGCKIEEAVNRPLKGLLVLMDDDTRQLIDDPEETCLHMSNNPAAQRDLLLLSRDGNEVGVKSSAASIRNRNGDVLGSVLVFHDLTEQRLLSREISYRARHDPLTGLLNRSEFDQVLKETHQHSKEKPVSHSLLYIDLDQFKIINDACGHSAGDELLRHVAKLLCDAVRAGDQVARLGGDEFAIILKNCPPQQARRIGDKICEIISDYRFIHDDKRFRIGASIGVVPVSDVFEDIAGIMQAADTSCYLAKDAGRNRIHMWTDTDKSLLARVSEMRWASRIEQALDEDRFCLYFQKIEPLGDSGLQSHAEILLRMIDKDGSLIQPFSFLPASERFNLATKIDRWVLKNVIKSWDVLVRGREFNTVCVNLSGQSIGDRSFHAEAMKILKSAGPDISNHICFEITETAAVTNIADAKAFIEQVQQLGVSIALDDFGAGASSFGYLKRLPINYLKIDGQFIKGLLDDPLNDATVRCFIEVAKLLGLKTIAEYVDSQAVMEKLKIMGVDFAQGFHLHIPEPVPGSDVQPIAAVA